LIPTYTSVFEEKNKKCPVLFKGKDNPSQSFFRGQGNEGESAQDLKQAERKRVVRVVMRLSLKEA
jgi:hypothetical protein